MGLCSWGWASQCGRLVTRENGLCQQYSLVLESAWLQGHSSPPGTLHRCCPYQHGTSKFSLSKSKFTIQLISPNTQDLRVSARGLPVHIENCCSEERGAEICPCSWQALGQLSEDWNDSAMESSRQQFHYCFFSVLHFTECCWLVAKTGRQQQGEVGEHFKSFS
jgi:hypothetical protein